MDIFAWAEEYMWCADYQDPHTGIIYACTEYRNNSCLPGIPAYQDGKLIGFAKKNLETKKTEFEEVE